MSGYYIVHVKVSQGYNQGFDLPACISKLANCLCPYSNATTLLHRFKVTGEQRVIAVFRVDNVIGFERTMSTLTRMGSYEVSCQPLLPYESFAQALGVDSSLTMPSPHKVTDRQLFWMEFEVEHPGKSTDQLLETWKREATASLSARVVSGMQIDLFKVIGERRVHCFISCSPEVMDNLAITLPIMKENGSNVKITCRGIQCLSDYVSLINSEVI